MKLACAVALLWAFPVLSQPDPAAMVVASAPVAVHESLSSSKIPAAMAPAMVVGVPAVASAPAITPVKTPPVPSKLPAAWWAVTLAQHGAVAFDSWSTRDSVSAGGRELDPLMRPFAGSAVLYPMMQTGPVGLDYVSLRMLRSRNRWVRRLWWAPQAALATGSVISGFHNIGVANAMQR